jgi:putative ABC transport system substrate-binding protein
MEVRAPAELDAVFQAASSRSPHGLLMLTAPFMSIYSKNIAELTLKYRLPAISMFPTFARAGGLMGYGPNLEDLYREVGVMTGKILKGAKPADLPAERPARFELVVNLKTAKVLDLNLSNLLLARANEVIE